MKEKASNYYKSGLSCSESLVQAAIDAGICDESVLPMATSFSGGMSSGCLCGAVAGAQLVLGCLYGKNNKHKNPEVSRIKAKEFIDRFKAIRKTTCCRGLTAGLEGAERKANCTSLVELCSEILEDMAGVKI